MRNLLKLAFISIHFGLLLGVAACAALPDAAGPTPWSITDHASQTAPVLPTEAAAAVNAAADPSPTALPHNLLDAPTTFEVVAAVHANLLQIAAWLPQGFSLFERQAIVQPIAEISMWPLEAVFIDYLPHPQLAESWQQAARIHGDFYAQLSSWLDGGLADEEFSQVLAGLLLESEALIGEAARIAEPLGVETSQYGPDFALARDVVFRLVPGIESQSQGWETDGATLPARQENPDLVVRQLNPFSYPFAGMDVLLTIGLLENTSPQAQQGVEVEIEFYNFLGEHLGTMTGRLLAQTALPGEVYPFSASIVKEGEEAALQDWVEYQVTVFSRPVSSGEVSYQDFSLSVSSTQQDVAGGILIEGSLTNRGAEAVALENVRIGVMALDSDGMLVGVGNGAALGTGSLASGQMAPIQAVIESLSGEPVTYQFFAEAIE